MTIEQKADVKKIENPCYHCYPGAIGECRSITNCQYFEKYGQFPCKPDKE